MARLIARYAAVLIAVILVLPSIQRTFALPQWATPLLISLCILGLPLAAAALWVINNHRSG